MKFVWFAIVIMLFVFNGCYINKSDERPTSISDTVSSHIVDDNFIKLPWNKAVNSFTFKLFQRTINIYEDSDNILLSPLSVAYALTMALNGAAGETETDMISTLELSGYTTDDINKAMDRIKQVLSAENDDIEISLANSFWYREDIPVRKEYNSLLEEYFSIESNKFNPGDSTIPTKINKWIDENTNGMIKEMIDHFDPRTIMMIINTICFDGKWSNEFDETKSYDAPFYNGKTTVSTVIMMEQINQFRIFAGDGFTMAELPYGEGNYVMDIILPDSEKNLKEIYTKLNPDSLSHWNSEAVNRNTILSIPRFRYQDKIDLNNILTEMGMGKAFGGEADFSGISEGFPLAIDNVLHHTFIETNEKGTKAAGATIIEIKGLSSIREESFVFRADHPFIYVIRETNSDLILFVGKISDPHYIE